MSNVFEIVATGTIYTTRDDSGVLVTLELDGELYEVLCDLDKYPCAVRQQGGTWEPLDTDGADVVKAWLVEARVSYE